MKQFARYLRSIARANGLGSSVIGHGNTHSEPKNARCQADVTWLFYPGMLQDSRQMWWADFGLRHACHEGIDICFYRCRGPINALPPGARVPALADGVLLHISPDLLGSTLAVSYGEESGAEGRPVLVYSHLAPEQGLSPGDPVRQGEIIARTFDARTQNSRLLSHLHLSCILVPKTCAPSDLNWHLFADREQVVHVNPVFL